MSINNIKFVNVDHWTRFSTLEILFVRMFFCCGVVSNAPSNRQTSQKLRCFSNVSLPLRSWLSQSFYPSSWCHSVLLPSCSLLASTPSNTVYITTFTAITLDHTRENPIIIIVDRAQHSRERDFVYTTLTTTTQCSHKVPREVTALRTSPREADREQRIRTSKHKRVRVHTCNTIHTCSREASHANVSERAREDGRRRKRTEWKREYAYARSRNARKINSK